MRKKNRILFLVYLVIILSFLFASTLLVINLFKVKNIVTNASPKLMNYFPNLDSELIFFVNEEKIRRHFLSDPSVESISIKKNYPDTLTINLKKREQVGFIIAKNGTFKVDSTGFLFDSASSGSASPIINLPEKELNVGNNITQSTINIALEVLKLAKEKGIIINYLNEGDSDSMRITLDTGLVVVIGSNRTAEEIVSSLQILLKNITIEGKTVREIDFRFDKPFLSF